MNRDSCFCKGLLLVHKMTPEALLRMWELVHDKRISCATTVHFT